MKSNNLYYYDIQVFSCVGNIYNITFKYFVINGPIVLESNIDVGKLFRLSLILYVIY